MRVELTSRGLTVRCLAARLLCRCPPEPRQGRAASGPLHGGMPVASGQRPVRDSNPSRLLDRQVATPAASQGGRVSGGSRTRLSTSARWCLGCSATDTRARAEGVEPSAPVLEAGCSPRSTPLSASGRGRTRTCKGLRLARLATGCHRACWLALPFQSGWPDLNRRSPAPQAGGLPGFPTS